ncbi:MAG: bifunctional phosphoribosylaminoimidazolecarboxamide formyltransferase/IMP cyclohydrolase [Chloroherpetonaceae bacterium]|nr:bifunctional phosphoribosylaminoimidazolecarboxamide formyltransferase/IMP cyclohydrolase [Chthonomonadaceae bacterium]MDW8208004.1 bifunctional phosphoribosylaminoimidazolecarboxamide formyltransferase/IMP cyclohydrolase [Chloroherpetonaceae bacterium]
MSRQPDGTRRALISVSNKTGLIPFAQGLIQLGFQILSTGGTARTLRDAQIPVTDVEQITGFPEMLDGRVKTLHPAVHGGILADRSKPDHLQAIAQQGIAPIDLVCVNLYPFTTTVARPDVTLEEAIENIDIGCPAMIRSAAKNHTSVIVVVHPEDYTALLTELQAHNGDVTPATRRALAVKAFEHTAQYDAHISAWMRQRFLTEPDSTTDSAPFPQELTLALHKVQDCRYGENPHQKAAFYVQQNLTEPCVATAQQIHGKELSFNNLYDLNAALETAKEFSEEPRPAAVIIKHANPCGVALGDTLAEAFQKAREADPVSAFGGILAVTQPIDVATAEEITGRNTFFEAIIAPGYAPETIPILTERKKWGASLRLLQVDPLHGWRAKTTATGYDFKRITGGLLLQTPDHHELTPDALQTVTERAPTEEELQELLFAYRVVKHVRSNAIVLSRNRQTIGVGAGQMNRVQSVRIAVEQAGQKARGAVMASDAFFPFPDGPEVAAQAGITAIIQPGGSVKDAETIAVANRCGIAMVFTGVRHFLH